MNQTPRGESQADQARLRRLELLYDATQGSTTGYIIPTEPLRDDVDRQELYPYLRMLQEQGLVRFDDSMVPRVGLTKAGVDLVEEFRRRREDRGGRRREIRRRFLLWIDAAGYRVDDLIDPSSMLAHDLAVVDGQRVDMDDVTEAVTLLNERELVSVEQTKASGEPHLIKLTPVGRECLDDHGGDLTGFLQEAQRAGITINAHHVAMATASGRGSLAAVHATYSSVDAVELFVAAFREALETLDLAPEDQATAESELDVLASGSAEPSRVRKAVGVLSNVAQGAAGSGLWQLISVYGSALAASIAAG